MRILASGALTFWAAAGWPVADDEFGPYRPGATVRGAGLLSPVPIIALPAGLGHPPLGEVFLVVPVGPADDGHDVGAAQSFSTPRQPS